MARAAANADIYQAVAEPSRRAILVYLAPAERNVGDISASLRIHQSSVSKHLRVLRETGLVSMRCRGREKLYRTHSDALRPLHSWTALFEQYWSHQLGRVKQRAEGVAKQHDGKNKEQQ